MLNARLVASLASIALCLATSLVAQHKPSHSAGARGSLGSAVDVSLDGNGWRMGSFEFGEGTKADAESEKFDDSAFKVVTVPGDTQLQAGFTGAAGFHESAGLMAVNAHEWWYRKYFRPAGPAAGTITKLVFDGVDYFTTVWLNGQLLGTHEGTYVAFSFDVTRLLRYGADNLLTVQVTHPWVLKDRDVNELMDGDFSMAFNTPLKKLPYRIAINWDELPAQGNAAAPMGIWRSVHLSTVSQISISDLHVYTKQINPDGSVLLHIASTVENVTATTQNLSLHLLLKPDNFTGSLQDIPALTVHALPGQTTAEANVRVSDAKLWWSWDHGPQNLYQLHAKIDAQGGLPGDQRTVRFGIRTVSRGADMAYRINGQKLFTKASWFPIENLYRSSATHEDYELDLRLYRAANFNLVTNFTVVEKPEFYNLCDELGILIVVELPFQQFGPMEALNKDSPRRELFLKESGRQVLQIVTAERNHPSVIQLSPLAEAQEKSGTWGFFAQNQFDQDGYNTFADEMKEIISRLAPDVVFHPSLCDVGEQHFWEAGQAYLPTFYQFQFDAQAKFISEFGTLSTDNLDSIGNYLTPKEQWDPGRKTAMDWFNLPIDIRAWSYWTDNMNAGLYGILWRARNFVDKQPRTEAELVTSTQIYHAFLMQYEVESYPRKKYDPVAGIRQWAFKDVGPGTRGTMLDYYHQPKVSYWWMKHAQAPVTLSFAYKDALESHVAGTAWSAPLYLINDLDREIHGTVHAELVAISGESVAAADYPISVAADSKAIAGTFSATLPKKAGVYVLRATLPSEAAGGQRVEEISFIKVVSAAFSAPHRVLLLAQKQWADPIRVMLENMGLAVDVFDENSTDKMASDLKDGAAIHSRYDVVWLGSFSLLGKVLPKETAKAVKDAVAAGSGFIATGGEGSFHGSELTLWGEGQPALVDATELNAVLPVDVGKYEDVEYGPHEVDDEQFTKHQIMEISAASNDAANDGYSPRSLELLQQYGLQGFNVVSPRPSSRVELTVAQQPLLVTGTFGAGKTVAFTGLTPVADKFTSFPIDEYFLKRPGLRTYFSLFADLLADVLPGNIERPGPILKQHETPLYQTLKEQPPTEFEVTKTEAVSVTTNVAHCRIRITNKGGYAHLVHIRFDWPSAAPTPFMAVPSDNDFELLPIDARDIDLEWRTSGAQQQTAGTVIVNAANAPDARMAF